MSNAKSRVKLTQKTLQSLTPKSKEYALWDTEVVGFHVRIFPTGVISFYVFYRAGHKERKRSLGKFPTIKVSDAREMARRLITASKNGEDPFGERDRDRLSGSKMLELWEYYWNTHAVPQKAPSSQREDSRLWNSHLKKRFAEKAVKDVTFEQIQSLHASMKGTPTEANRMLSLLSKMMSIAISRDIILKNPCKDVKRFADRRRQRILNDDELKKLRCSIDAEKIRDRGAAVMVELLMLTGARRGEALKAKWEDFDCENAVWNVPPSTIKGGVRHNIILTRPLSGATVELLKSWKLETNTKTGYVFPSLKDPSRRRYDIKRPWDRIRKEAGIPKLRLHDLRHCFATYAREEGMPLEAIGRSMGHRSPLTTLRYANVQKTAMKAVADAVSSRVRG